MFGFNKKRGLRAITTTIDEWSGSNQKPSENTFSHTDHEEWIWVDGYKGTNDDMTCQGYQFELGKQFDMPDDARIVLCRNGFHFCRELRDVYAYYELHECHRFFKVRALVRKKDYDRYGQYDISDGRCWQVDKLVAKSIIFERELSTDELIAVTEFKDDDVEVKKYARKYGLRDADTFKHALKLEPLGYNRDLGMLLTRAGDYELAAALGKQSDLSWDTRIQILFNHK